MVVARTPDVGVEDRRAVRGPLQDARVEIVVEDGLDRAIGAGFDLKRPEARRLYALAAEGLCKPDDAKARPEALLGMGPVLEDEVAKGRGGGANRGRLPADPLDGPVR